MKTYRPLDLPPGAVHALLGSESEVDEATAAAVSQSPDLMSFVHASRMFESVNVVFGISKDGLENCILPSHTAYIHEESRENVVQEFLAQPDGKKFLEFECIFLSGPCSRGHYDVRLDFMFCLIKSNDSYPDQTNLLCLTASVRVKCTGHPDETPRNLMAVLHLIKLCKRQAYFLVKHRQLAEWRQESAIPKAVKALFSHWWFPPLMLLDIATMIRESRVPPYPEIVEETEEDRNRAMLKLTDNEIKVLTAAGLYKNYS